MPPVTDFRFLIIDPQNDSLRNHELQISEARAHAAHTAHERRRSQSALTSPRLKIPRTRTRQQYDDFSGSPRSSEAGNTEVELMKALKPCTILQKGNSDPFNTTAVPITAESNDILFFYYVNVLPLFNAYIEASGVSVSTGRASWHDPFTNFSDEPTACGVLARSAAIMSRTTDARPSVAVQASTSKEKLFKMLRNHFDEGSQLSSRSRLYQCMISLLIAAVFENALEAARMHLSILQKLLHSESTTANVDPSLLFTILWYDFLQASKSLTRPVFDFGGWAADQFRPSWLLALEHCSRLSDWPAGGLDRSIEDNELRKIFATLRQVIKLSEAPALETVHLETSVLMGMARQALICQGQLVVRYGDARLAISEALEEAHRIRCPTGFLSRMYAQMYVALAALWWTRCIKKEENLPLTQTSTILNAGDSILPALREALIRSARLMPEGKENLHARSRLWAYYVGTLAETADVETGKCLYQSNDKWFTQSYRSQAQRMSLKTWLEVRKLLQGFLYSDRMKLDNVQLGPE